MYAATKSTDFHPPWSPTLSQIRFKRKHLIYFLLIVGFIIFIYDPFRTDSHPYQSRPQDGVTLRTNVFFLKTHKAASSTVQNIFMRFGLRHSLNFLLPERSNYLAYKASINGTKDLAPDLTPMDRKFNIFAHHSRYHRETNRYLYDDTVRVTILRYPPQHFESAFDFFHWSGHYNVTLRELLTRTPKEEQLMVAPGRRPRQEPMYNRMSYDLGLERSRMGDDGAIRDFVNYIDTQFDYVMITEYMEASLVMLADLMGWPLEYMATVPMLIRIEDRLIPLTSDDELKLSALNRADTILYEHNLEKFRERVRRYGLDELTEGIKKLRRLNKALADRCVNSTHTHGVAGTMGYQIRDPTDWECRYATKPELSFTDELREEQKDRLKIIKSVNELVSAHREGAV